MTGARSFSAGMALLFVLAALLQWNDPDPLPWMLTYGAVALLAGAHATARIAHAGVCVALAVALAAGALSLSGSLLEADRGAFTRFEMKDTVAEEAREALGLWIASGYALWLALRSRRPTRRP